MFKKSCLFLLVAVIASITASTWAQTAIEAANDLWIRESAPDTPYNGDGITVWNNAKSELRYGLLEFDLSAWSGYAVAGAKLELYSANHSYSDKGTAIKQSAHVIDCSTGTALADLDWTKYMAEKDAGKIALEGLGVYDLPTVTDASTELDKYYASDAAGLDLTMLQDVLDAGGTLCMVLIAAEEDGPIYARSWGDGEAGWSGGAPRLVLDITNGKAIRPDPESESGKDDVLPDVTLSWKVMDSLYTGVPTFEVYYTDANNLSGVSAQIPTNGGQDIFLVPAALLEHGTPYIWRVDVTDPNTGGTPVTHTGDVWTFTTAPARVIASNPTPDGTAVDPSVTLIWDSDENAVANEVYLRQPGSFDDGWYLIKTLATSGAGTSYTPSDDMEIRWDDSFEWRVDTVFEDPAETLEGDVWTFNTTTPVCNGGERLPGDENGDCLVTLADLAVKVSNWLVCGWEPQESCGMWPPPPSSNITITTHMEIWIRSLAPDATYENDGGGVYSSATGGIRATLVEFDLSALEGKTLTGARLFAWNIGTWSGNADPCKSHAFIIDPNQTPAGSSSWNTYQAEYAGAEVALDLGAFDVPAGAPSEYFGSTFASAADLELIEAETIANGGDGILTLVLTADEDGSRYRFDIGDDPYYGDRMFLEFLTE